MKNYLIFPALICYCLVEILTGSNKFIWMIFMIAILLRVIFLKKTVLLLSICIIGSIFYLVSNEEKISEIAPQDTVLTIYPDQIKINGDMVSGYTNIEDQKVRFFYQLKSFKEKQIWSSLSDPFDTSASIDKVEKISVPRNPGEFNYQKFLSNRNIYYSVKLAKVTSLKIHSPDSFTDRINVLRIHLIKKLSKLPKWLRIHSQSLILGYSNGEDKDFFDSLSVLGVIHLFSLSGLHVLILVNFFRKFFSTIKITQEVTDSFLLILLPMYGILVGSKIGIWRAIILSMIGIFLNKLKIKISTLDVFSLTLLICLFVQPKSILDMGGQLSFILSFALLFIYDSENIIFSTLKLNLVSLPIICNYTYQFSWLILITNLLFVPFFSYVILPITILSSLLPEISLWNFVNTFFEVIYSFLSHVSQNRSFILVTGKLPLVIVLILIIVSLLNLEKRGVKNKYMYCYLVVFISTILFNKFPLFGQVSLIDVGQGDSILVTTPILRKTILIDTGGKISFPQKDWQKGVKKNQVEISTIPYLKSQGISKIDRVFLSHKDIDHMGNLPTLLDKFPVTEVSFGNGLQDNKSIQKIIVKHPEVRFSSLKQGDNFDINNISWKALWPKKRSIGENGDSLTLLADIHDKSWLFTGDLDIDGEQNILNDYKLKIDYLKAGHHGSKTSSGDDLLKKSDPGLVLISAGVNNRYGHPNKETIKRYDKYSIPHMNTADYGMITWYYYPFSPDNKIKTYLKGEVIENSRIKK